MRFKLKIKSLVLKSTVMYMGTFEEKVEDMAKETAENKLENCKTIGDVKRKLLRILIIFN